MGLIFCFVIQTRETLTLFTQTQHKPKGINPNPTFANNFTNPPLLWDRLALDRPLHPPFHFTHLTFRSEGEQIRGKSLRVLFYFESCHCWQNKNKVTRCFFMAFLIKKRQIMGISKNIWLNYDANWKFVFKNVS